MKKTLASHYYTAETATGEKEVFGSLDAAIEWRDKVRFTFCLPEMPVEIREVTEKIITD